MRKILWKYKRMKSEYTIKERTTGIFMLLAFISLLIFIAIIGSSKDLFKSYNVYYTTFNESYNLKKNSAVKLFNADIGKVRKITPYGNKVRMELLILDDFASRIRKDTVVTVESPTFIGSEYISVYPGDSESEQLLEKDEIKSKEKKSITEIMEEFQITKTARMFVKAIQDISNITESLSKPTGPLFSSLDSLNKTINNLEMITNNIKEGKSILGEVVNPEYQGTVIDDIKKASSYLPNLIQNIQNLLMKIDNASDMLNASLYNIKEGSAYVPEINRSLLEGISEIRNSVENIDKVVKSLQENFFIKLNLPEYEKGKNIELDLR